MGWRAAIVCFAGGALILPGAAWAELGPKSKLGREKGAIYLEDILDKDIRLKVKQAAPIFYQLDGKRRLGTMVAGSEVTLLALSDRAYRVRGKATHAQVSGWMGPDYLDGLDDELKENLKKLYARQLIVEDLIDNKQVALGMTMDETKRALGEPTRTSSKLDKTGRKDTFEYITYKRVPQYTTGTDDFGQLYTSVIYVQVETGKVSIEFEDEMVTSIAESEGTPSSGPIKTVPAPIEITY